MISEYEQLVRKSNLRNKDIMRNLKHISKMNKVGFDRIVSGYHDEIFAKIDCRKCGNCCRTMSPRFRETDIKLLCKAIGLNPRAFEDEYLKDDEEGVGHVLKVLPCPFQNSDNDCTVYENRTLSCSDFPHTRSRNIQKNLEGLAHDSLICPAAYLIAEKIIAEY